MKNSKRLGTNAALNVIKQLFTILFPLITFPYASRILGVANYGKINFSSSIISYISLIAGLGVYNYAIREGARVRESKNKLKKLSNEIFTINCASTAIAYLILGLLLVFNNKLSDYSWLLLIQSSTILFTTLGIDWFNVIHEDYFFITLRYILCQGLSLFLMFILVRNQEDYLQYAFTSVISSIIANILNLFYIKKQYQYIPCITFNKECLIHFKSIMIMFGSAIATLIYINSDVTILGILKNDTIVGYYSVSAKIYTLIKQLLNALLVVAMPRLSSEIAKLDFKMINKHYNQIFSYLVLILGPACTGLFMLSDNIILLFSGSEYLPAASSLRILSVSLLFATIACFYVNVIMIPNRMEKYVLRATVISAVTNIVLNFILIPFWGQNAAALTTVIAELLMFICGVYYTKKIAQLHFNKNILISFICSIGVVILCIISKMFLLNNTLIIVISLGVSILLWVICIMAFYRKEIMTFIRCKHR